MWWIIGYIAGCIVAYILTALHNDSHFYGKMSGFWIITSWIVPLSVILGVIIYYILEMNTYPSLKWFKKK